MLRALCVNVFLAVVLAATGAGAATAAPAYKWATSNPGGAPAGQIIYVVHGSPRDLTDFNVHLACVPGQDNVTLGLRTRGFGGYRPQALKGQEAMARVFVDGKLAATQAVKLTAWDDGVETQTEAGRMRELFAALEKGRRLRVELPKAKTATISLAGFAPLAKLMRAHCGL